MILINKFLILSIFIILLPRISFGNTNNYKLYEIKNYHNQFCSKLVSNITNQNIKNEWIITEKNNNYQLLINKNKKIKLKLQSFVRKKLMIIKNINNLIYCIDFTTLFISKSALSDL